MHSKHRKCGEAGFLYKDKRLYYCHIIYRIIYRTKNVYYRIGYKSMVIMVKASNMSSYNGMN